MHWIHLKAAAAGDVLAADLFINDRLLLKSGTTLNERSISSLKEHDIKNIAILNVPASQDAHRNYIFHEDHIDKSLAEDLFFRTIEAIGYEHRYGKLLNNHKDVQYLLECFHHSFVRNGGGTLLYELAKHDAYSYYHSFDVFLLGTMAAKRLGFDKLDKLAEGFLYHAAAHLAVPQDLLQLPRRLTRYEKGIYRKSLNEGNALIASSALASVIPYATAGKRGNDPVPGEHLLLLEIVRTYSTLTLSGPFKTYFPAQEALQILFENIFDQELLIRFSQLLEIYPENAIVRLSDQSLAIVEHARFSTPAFPIVRRLAEQPAHLAATRYAQIIKHQENSLPAKLTKRISNSVRASKKQRSGMLEDALSPSNMKKVANHTASFHLPLDFSLTIKELMSYQPPVFEEHFDQFVDALVHVNKTRAKQMRFILSGHTILENLYFNLYIPAYVRLLNLHDKNALADEDFNSSCELLKQLLPEIKELFEKEPHDCIGSMPESLALTLRLFEKEQNIVSPLVRALQEVQGKAVLTTNRKKLILITEKAVQNRLDFRLLVNLLQLDGYDILLKDVQHVKVHDLAFAVSHGYGHLIIIRNDLLSLTNDQFDTISKFSESLSGMNMAHYALDSFNKLLQKDSAKRSLFDEIFLNIHC